MGYGATSFVCPPPEKLRHAIYPTDTKKFQASPPCWPVLFFSFIQPIETPKQPRPRHWGSPSILPLWSRNLHGVAVGDRERDAALVADEALLELGDELDASTRVVEELETALDILEFDGLGLALLA